MSDFDADDCLRRYRALTAASSNLFTNPAGLIYEILLKPAEIAAAQDAARRQREQDGLSAADTRIGVIAEDPYITATRDAVRFADGTLGIYNRLLIPSGVVILPVLRGEIVLIHRFRHGTRRFVYEVPRGMLSADGDFERTAREELREEIGATAVSLTSLGEYHSNSSVANDTMRLFFAEIDTIGAPSRHEAIDRIETFTVERVESFMRDGKIMDGATLAVYLRAKLNHLIG